MVARSVAGMNPQLHLSLLRRGVFVGASKEGTTGAVLGTFPVAPLRPTPASCDTIWPGDFLEIVWAHNNVEDMAYAVATTHPYLAEGVAMVDILVSSEHLCNPFKSRVSSISNVCHEREKHENQGCVGFVWKQVVNSVVRLYFLQLTADPFPTRPSLHVVLHSQSCNTLSFVGSISLLSGCERRKASTSSRKTARRATRRWR